MARNQEKAQSMLYRFREAQAQSLGLVPKPTRRPRLASSVSSLKECERWRGEVIREISRKVSKIQDFGLTDYEVRDLNDDINKLIREKGHWENQILALGGANYKRGVPSMLGGGDEGVGKGGYKYFGRAKDLPGVKEMFTGKGKDEGEGWRSEKYQRFKNLPSSYYGDDDEDDPRLLDEEMRGEEVEWNERYLQVITGIRRDLRRRDGQDEDEMDVSDNEDSGSNGGIEIPTIPRPKPKSWKDSMQAVSQSFSTSYTQPVELEDSTSAESAKRPQDDQDQDSAGSTKRQKRSDGQAVPTLPSQPNESAQTHAQPSPAVAYSIFTADDLQHPTLPDRAAIEKMILNAKKRQLRQEYVG